MVLLLAREVTSVEHTYMSEKKRILFLGVDPFFNFNLTLFIEVNDDEKGDGDIIV